MIFPGTGRLLRKSGTFRTDNLAFAKARGGLPAVIDMAISDAFNAGKPGVGKAALLRPSVQSAFSDAPAQSVVGAPRLTGQRPTEAFVPPKPFSLGN